MNAQSLTIKEKYGMDENEMLAKVKSLEIGKLYSYKGTNYIYEGKGRLRNAVACGGYTPVLDYKGDITNVMVIAELKESEITREEFDKTYKLTSQSMAEFCARFGTN